MGDFGHNLGIAFQITDDLLDIVGEEGTTGKTLGSDVCKNKLTLAVVHLLKVIDEKERGMIKNKLSTMPTSKSQRAKIAEMLSSYGCLEYTRNRAQEFITKATASLAGMKENDAKEALIEVAKFVANRAF